jgi:hypothetical protein
MEFPMAVHNYDVIGIKGDCRSMSGDHPDLDTRHISS